MYEIATTQISPEMDVLFACLSVAVVFSYTFKIRYSFISPMVGEFTTLQQKVDYIMYMSNIGVE